MKTIIIGLGNPILGDDAIGCVIAENLCNRLQEHISDQLVIEPFYRGGIALMEHMIGFDRAIIIDAIQGLGGHPGTIHKIEPDELPTLYTNSPHDTSLNAAIELGKKLGAKLPHKIAIFAIEISNQVDFSEQLSHEVECSINETIEQVISELNIENQLISAE